jgi:hypothetical protein
MRANLCNYVPRKCSPRQAMTDSEDEDELEDDYDCGTRIGGGGAKLRLSRGAGVDRTNRVIQKDCRTLAPAENELRGDVGNRHEDD